MTYLITDKDINTKAQSIHPTVSQTTAATEKRVSIESATTRLPVETTSIPSAESHRPEISSSLQPLESSTLVSLVIDEVTLEPSTTATSAIDFPSSSSTPTESLSTSSLRPTSHRVHGVTNSITFTKGQSKSLLLQHSIFEHPSRKSRNTISNL